jgi:cytochrome c biogenesis protein CcmG, thiol:disulfide interchange protein DsbE
VIRRWVFLLPLVMAALLGGLFFYGLRAGRNPAEIRSVLLGKPAPAFDLPALGGGRFTEADLRTGHVVIVNFFASWCVPCRAEQAQLMRLARQSKIPVYGIAWKDSPENTAAFLQQLGNPFTRVGIDQNGRTGINWGVAGVPESYILSPGGVIGFRHWGDIRPEHVEDRILPAVRKLERER